MSLRIKSHKLHFNYNYCDVESWNKPTRKPGTGDFWKHINFYEKHSPLSQN